jgi:hypothetical protein
MAQQRRLVVNEMETNQRRGSGMGDLEGSSGEVPGNREAACALWEPQLDAEILQIGSGQEGQPSHGPAGSGDRELVDLKLAPGERLLLERCERAIAGGLKAFFEVGRALAMIRDSRLYRQSYASFQEYCQERWSISRFYGYRLMGAARVMERLLTIGNIPLPRCEGQARMLTKVPAERVVPVWQLALELAEGKEVSTRHLGIALTCMGYDSLARGSGVSLPSQPAYATSLVIRQIGVLRRQVRQEDWRGGLESLERLRVMLEQLESR